MSRLLSLLVVISISLLTALPIQASSDDQQLDNIYRVFFNPKIKLSDVTPHYAENVIHVSKPKAPLLIGKESFMATNIVPLIQMIRSGQMTFSGKVYLVRRIIKGDMANDVGYLYAEVRTPDGQHHRQLQKFSWVFVKTDGHWKVVTDFDATLADIDKVTDLAKFRLLE